MRVIQLSFLILLLTLCLSSSLEAGITVGTLSLERDAQPGESYQGTVVVTNNGDEPEGAHLYQTDYLFFSDGSNEYGDAGTLVRSNANWITFSPRQVIVPPHQSSTVSYQVKVPDDPSLSGTYWSMLMIEAVPVTKDSEHEMNLNHTQVRQVVRYGVQCITNIGDTGKYQLNFIGTQMIVKDGKELQVDVENVGDRWVVPHIWIELYALDGCRVGRFESESRRIFPGTSVRFQINLSEVPSGKYRALVVMDNEDNNVLGAKYDLEF